MHLLNEEAMSFLSKLPFWKKNEILISTESAGAGNMNVVLRVKTNIRTVIAKQSFPFVRKFPQIPAPIERIETEYQFLKLANKSEQLSSFLPKVLAYFPEQHIMIMEDFGEGSDYTFLYGQNQSLKALDFQFLIGFLDKLHQLEIKEFPDNLAMMELNHEHIFRFPFELENGFNLDSVEIGLQEASMIYKNDSYLKKTINELGKQYLCKGNYLLHGDFYPGSWLKVGPEIKIIDPEFGFLGDREFDLGVFIAHLIFSGMDRENIIQGLNSYSLPFSKKLAWQFAGVELMRRLIGIAQLPLVFKLDRRIELLEEARTYILAND